MILQRHLFLSVMLAGFMQTFSLMINAQRKEVQFVPNDKAQKIDVFIGGHFFTSYRYAHEKLEKPVLYPIQTASGQLITRGYPLEPRAGERVDHPHHVGLWMNFESVNGLDFWNNSFAIPAEKKSHYGSIRHEKIISMKGGKEGRLVTESYWVTPEGKKLLKEITTFVFGGDTTHRIIDRVSKLTALDEKVVFEDRKDGFLGLRVDRALELPADKPEIFTDDKGHPTAVPVMNNTAVTGNYLTSEGKTGNEAWSTRGKWCMLYGKKNGEDIAIVIFDHPKNIGYPTNWHARGYGLFAANPLGPSVFEKGRSALNLTLQPHESVIFRYRIEIFNGKIPASTELNAMEEKFGKTY